MASRAQSNLVSAGIRLAVFDLDGTLTTVRSPFLFISEELGVGDKARELGNSYLRGEIDFCSWGAEIVNNWKGTPLSMIQAILAHIPYRPGCKEFISGLKSCGVKTALISVAFSEHVVGRAQYLGVEEVVCNRLHVERGLLTGGYTHEIDDENKCAVVRKLQDRFGIGCDETLVAGDTEADIPMFEVSRISIAVAPESDKVVSAAKYRLPDDDWSAAGDILANQEMP